MAKYECKDCGQGFKTGKEFSDHFMRIEGTARIVDGICRGPVTTVLVEPKGVSLPPENVV